MDKSEVYKELYFHAFNCYTELIEQAQTMQKELEEMYLLLTENNAET